MQSPWTKQIELGKLWVGCSARRQDCSQNSIYILKQIWYQTKIKPFREWKGEIMLNARWESSQTLTERLPWFLNSI